MSVFRIYINPRDELGNFTNFIDVSQDIIATSLGSINRVLDSDKFDVGIFKFDSFSIFLRNEFGTYSDINNPDSIFKFRRSGSKIKVTWAIQDYESECGCATAGLAKITPEIDVFEGYLNDESSTLEIQDQQIRFDVLGYDSVFTEVETPSIIYDAVVGQFTYREMFYYLLDVPEIRQYLDFGLTETYTEKNTNTLQSIYDPNFAEFAQKFTIDETTKLVQVKINFANIIPTLNLTSSMNVEIRKDAAGFPSLNPIDVTPIGLFEIPTQSTNFTIQVTDLELSLNPGAYYVVMIPDASYFSDATSVANCFQIALNTIDGSGFYFNNAGWNDSLSLTTGMDLEVLTSTNENINPGLNLVIDSVGGLINTTVKEALDVLLFQSNSVFYIENNSINIKPREGGLTPVKTFYGQASNQGIEDIINISEISIGLNNVFNYWTWTDTTLISKDTNSIEENGIRKKEISFKEITDTGKRQTILDAQRIQFSNKLQELVLTVPLDYENAAIKILDQIRIDYPTVYISSGSNLVLPFYGVSIYEQDTYPIAESSITIEENTKFKVIGIRIDTRNQIIDFKIKEFI